MTDCKPPRNNLCDDNSEVAEKKTKFLSINWFNNITCQLELLNYEILKNKGLQNEKKYRNVTMFVM